MMPPVETARKVVAYRPDPKLRDRIDVLAEKSTEGELIEQERAEYQGYVRGNNFDAILQAKARVVLATSTIMIGAASAVF